MAFEQMINLSLREKIFGPMLMWAASLQLLWSISEQFGNRPTHHNNPSFHGNTVQQTLLLNGVVCLESRNIVRGWSTSCGAFPCLISAEAEPCL